ncbi:MAG TPA: hypothetical protein VFU98_08365 [Microlunatus sp.]|nr:hypothetical protein [Microlunatus sp.]
MWVWIYLAIAVAGLVMVGCFAVWLWRLAIALLREAGVLMDRADQFAALLGQIGQPPEPDDDVDVSSRRRPAT